MRIVKILVVILVAVWAAAAAVPDGKLHVVFCDVGQGDAILVMQGTTQMLVDGGPPGRRAADCLANNMPFWDRRVELVVLTHPDADHSGGLVNVWKRYTVLQFVTVPVGKETTAFAQLMRQVSMTKSQITNIFTGDRVRVGEMEFEVVWPERSWVASRVDEQESVRAGAESAVLGARTEAETNLFSIGGILKYREFEVMLTGDADQAVLPQQIATGRLRDVEVLKVPHHGSKYGMSPGWLAAIRPELAVISVGRNNYGHPTQEALDLLAEAGTRVLRTDVDGEIEVVSDGVKWWVK